MLGLIHFFVLHAVAKGLTHSEEIAKYLSLLSDKKVPAPLVWEALHKLEAQKMVKSYAYEPGHYNQKAKVHYKVTQIGRFELDRMIDIFENAEVLTYPPYREDAHVEREKIAC